LIGKVDAEIGQPPGKYGHTGWRAAIERLDGARDLLIGENRGHINLGLPHATAYAPLRTAARRACWSPAIFT